MLHVLVMVISIRDGHQYQGWSSVSGMVIRDAMFEVPKRNENVAFFLFGVHIHKNFVCNILFPRLRSPDQDAHECWRWSRCHGTGRRVSWGCFQFGLQFLA